MVPEQQVKNQNSISPVEAQLVTLLVDRHFNESAVWLARQLGMNRDSFLSCVKEAHDRAVQQHKYQDAEKIHQGFLSLTQPDEQVLTRFTALLESVPAEEHLEALQIAVLNWLPDERLNEAAVVVWTDLADDESYEKQLIHAKKYGLSTAHRLPAVRGLIKKRWDSYYSSYDERAVELFQFARREVGDDSFAAEIAQTLLASLKEKGRLDGLEKTFPDLWEMAKIAKVGHLEEFVLFGRYAELVRKAMMPVSVRRIYDDQLLNLNSVDQFLQDCSVDPKLSHVWDVRIFDEMMGRKEHLEAYLFAFCREALGGTRRRKAAEGLLEELISGRRFDFLKSSPFVQWLREKVLEPTGLAGDWGTREKLRKFYQGLAVKGGDKALSLALEVGLDKEFCSPITTELQKYYLNQYKVEEVLSINPNSEHNRRLAVEIYSSMLTSNYFLRSSDSLNVLGNALLVAEKLGAFEQLAIVAHRIYFNADREGGGADIRRKKLFLVVYFKLPIGQQELGELTQQVYRDLLDSTDGGWWAALTHYCPLDPIELRTIGLDILTERLSSNLKVDSNWVRLVATRAGLPSCYQQLVLSTNSN